MNMQTIQIMILLLDSFIKLAPWRIVTETMDRIGCSASEGLARSLVVIVAACAGFCALPTASIFGPLLLIGYVGAANFIAYATGQSAVQPNPVRILPWRDGVERALATRPAIAHTVAVRKPIHLTERGVFHA
jgi:hypothetical protein